MALFNSKENKEDKKQQEINSFIEKYQLDKIDDKEMYL